MKKRLRKKLGVGEFALDDTAQLEEGIIPLAPLPADHSTDDFAEHARQVSYDLAARPRRRRKATPSDRSSPT